MTCTACTAAERTPRTAARENGCMGCKARMLAGTGAHLASKAARRVTPEYRAVLEEVFGADWQAGAAQVKAWGERIDRAAAAI